MEKGATKQLNDGFGVDSGYSQILRVESLFPSEGKLWRS